MPGCSFLWLHVPARSEGAVGGAAHGVSVEQEWRFSLSLSACLLLFPSLVLSFLPYLPLFLPSCFFKAREKALIPQPLYLPQTQQPLDQLFEIPLRSFVC